MIELSKDGKKYYEVHPNILLSQQIMKIHGGGYQTRYSWNKTMRANTRAKVAGWPFGSSRAYPWEYWDKRLKREAKNLDLREKRGNARQERRNRLQRLENMGIPIMVCMDRIKNKEMDFLLDALEKRLG